MASSNRGGKPTCTHTELVAAVAVLEATLQGLKEQVQFALTASDKAVLKAELAVEKRLEGLNELRGLNEDQAKTFARDSEVKLAQAGLDKRIDDLSVLVHLQQGKGLGVTQMWVWVLGALAVAVTYFHK